MTFLPALRGRTWRPTAPALVFEGAEAVLRDGIAPPAWLGYAELVEDMHAHRRQFGAHALSVALFRVTPPWRGGRRGPPELWGLLVAGDRRKPTWLVAFLTEEDVGNVPKVLRNVAPGGTLRGPQIVSRYDAGLVRDEDVEIGGWCESGHDDCNYPGTSWQCAFCLQIVCDCVGGADDGGDAVCADCYDTLRLGIGR